MNKITANRQDPYAALKIPEFRLYVLARFFTTIAVQMMAVVVGWQVYEITKDPFSLGLIGLAEAIPAISVSLLAGHVADRNDRKTIIISVMTLLVLCAGILWSLSTGSLEGKFPDRVIPIYCVLFITGIARGFFGPAIFAFMPQLLPDKSYYNNAVTWNSTTWQTAAVGGPALGGIVYGFAGVTYSYITITLLLLVATMLFIMIGRKEIPGIEAKEPVGQSLRRGLEFVFKNQLILSALSLDLFAVLFGGATVLLPMFAAEILHSGPQGLGVLRAAPAFGAAITAAFLAHNPLRQRAGIKMLFAVAGFGVCMILFALSHNFWVSLFLLTLSGAFDSISVVTRHTLIHTFTPENMKGRVASVNNIFIGSSNEIGAFESGVAARILGLVPSVIFGGTMTMLVVAFTAWKADKLRKLDFE
jgi:MFS family permease